MLYRLPLLDEWKLAKEFSEVGKFNAIFIIILVLYSFINILVLHLMN